MKGAAIPQADSPPSRTERFEAWFRGSRNAMLLADDERGFADANHAACLLLRLPRREIVELTIDDLAAPDQDPDVEELWQRLMEAGTLAGTFAMALPDGSSLEVDFSAAANVLPGRHLSIVLPTHLRDRAESVGESHGEGRAGGISLSRREREVLAQVASGRPDEEIAHVLGVSPETVRTHWRNARRKLGARNRPHGVAIAIRHGLIPWAATASAPVPLEEPDSATG
jgi:DNA-binding CsgD family transcriptional regulator